MQKVIGLSASEALFGFTGWLTSRPERTVMSSRDEAGIIADLVGEFCDANQLPEPRTGWTTNLVYPPAIVYPRENEETAKG